MKREQRAINYEKHLGVVIEPGGQIDGNNPKKRKNPYKCWGMNGGCGKIWKEKKVELAPITGSMKNKVWKGS